MRAHYLQHVPFEGLGSIGPWLKIEKFDISSTQFFKSDLLPDITEPDLLVVLGGPMSVNDVEIYPWLVKEKVFIQEFIKSGKPVLGICLGAQLIANALGKKVYRNNCKEIGWFPVHSTNKSNDSLFQFPDSSTVFHWHGETFDLPDNSDLLASSKGCQNQAFQFGSSVVGLQFHLETTPESARLITHHCRDELTISQYVQTEKDILSARPQQYLEINQLMELILNYLTKKTKKISDI